jgi:hypothetical protein
MHGGSIVDSWWRWTVVEVVVVVVSMLMCFFPGRVYTWRPPNALAVGLADSGAF